MLKFEIVIHDEMATSEDIDDLLGSLRYAVKYADGMGDFSINLVEDDVDR
jgi:hypothetical protein